MVAKVQIRSETKVLYVLVNTSVNTARVPKKLLQSSLDVLPAAYST